MTQWKLDLQKSITDLSAQVNTLQAIHESIDLFFERLFVHDKALGDNAMLVYHIKGFASVLVMVQNAQGDVAPPSKPLVAFSAGRWGDRYELGGYVGGR
ncbi:hypothetical protein SARC_04868 [Sphaeroforma arctica JP610]|uniref:Uncharacterized protein n=1 Tax=Sphaeroforma arctica JP610 TaxID=667725 RepID=A0A0L0G203_9EUKA|nr:hypothetical protein SARC_04868 [Sphaeroforma arctica JP610]KNC82869.1 hypothetical protein SARC_04868 [Sphaeroforma arctica JP610]|eukprot:XP_014156771.1 hypothetical protein SARC_04868 [Sphaeroforma arctica JP610]